MTSVFASRRRAEEFHSLVEATGHDQPRDVQAEARLEDFLAIVESLRSVPEPEPRPEFVTSLRAELMSAADTLLVPQAAAPLTLPPRNTRRDRRIAAAIGGLAVVGAGTSMAVAAQSALPGEMLYPFKRAIENAEVGAASSPETKSLTLLDRASSRLLEVEALDRAGHLTDDSLEVSGSFVDFGEQATAAADYILDSYERTGDEELIRELRDFTGASMDSLERLEPLVPDSARDELLAAVDVVNEIDARARAACPGCGGRGVEEIPAVLLSSAATDPQVVVIPGATVQTWTAPREGDRKAGSRRGSGSGSTTSTGDAGDAGDSLTDPLVTAPDGGSDGGSGSGGDPLTDLTDTLTGGSDPKVSDGGAGEKVKDTVDGVGETVDKVKKGVEDTTGDLGDGLGGGLPGG